MADYKEMYLSLFDVAEDAIHILIEAQGKCEEMYISAPKTGLRVLEFGASEETEHFQE